MSDILGAYEPYGTHAYGQDEVGRAIVGLLDILSGRGDRQQRRGERLSSRLERRGGAEENQFLANRVARLLGKPGQGVVVADDEPATMRRLTFNLGRKTIGAGLTDALAKTAQKVIRIERLLLSSTELASFDVTQIILGVDFQNANIAAGPAEAYAFNAVATSLRGTTLQIGQEAQVTCVNNNAAPQSISGTFFGEAISNM